MWLTLSFCLLICVHVSCTFCLLLFVLPYGSMGEYLVYCVFVIQPYGSMGVFSLLFFFVFWFVCTVTDSSAAEKDSEILHACSTTIRIGLLPFW